MLRQAGDPLKKLPRVRQHCINRAGDRERRYLPIRTTGVGIGALLVGYRDSEGRLQFAGRVDGASPT
jgi:hypothetical protein